MKVDNLEERYGHLVMDDRWDNIAKYLGDSCTKGRRMFRNKGRHYMDRRLAEFQLVQLTMLEEL